MPALTETRQKPSPRVAAMAIILSSVFFTIGAILARLQSGVFSGQFISLFRFAAGVVFCSITLSFGGRGSWKPVALKPLFLRGLTGAIGMTLYFVAIQYIGSSRATLYLNTFPIWVALFGVVFFRNKLGKFEIPAIALCIIGAVLIFREPGILPVLGIAAGLAAGVVRGIAVHMVKKSGKGNHPAMVYLSVCLFGLLLLPFYYGEFANITDISQVLVLSAIGFTMFLSQLLIAWGLRGLSPTTGSILIYSNIPMTLGLGLLIGEQLTLIAWCGAALIIAGLILPALVKRRVSL
jgi:drug/metabolite transporter (DMT)-like permease